MNWLLGGGPTLTVTLVDHIITSNVYSDCSRTSIFVEKITVKPAGFESCQTDQKVGGLWPRCNF